MGQGSPETPDVGQDGLLPSLTRYLGEVHAQGQVEQAGEGKASTPTAAAAPGVWGCGCRCRTPRFRGAVEVASIHDGAEHHVWRTPVATGEGWGWP